jgi:hypothetical protein
MELILYNYTLIVIQLAITGGETTLSKDKRVTMKIPRHLYERLKAMIRDTGFSSVNEFIVYVMRDIASAGRLDQEIGLSKQEIEQVRKRLRGLGYLPYETEEEKV